MSDTAWVDVATLVEPFNEWLATHSELPVGDTRAPVADGTPIPPPYYVTNTVAAVRIGDGQASEAVRWSIQVTAVGGTDPNVSDKGSRPLPQQARPAGARAARLICATDYAGTYLTEMDLGPSVRVLARESDGDGHLQPGEHVDNWVETFVLTVQPT